MSRTATSVQLPLSEHNTFSTLQKCSHSTESCCKSEYISIHRLIHIEVLVCTSTFLIVNSVAPYRILSVCRLVHTASSICAKGGHPQPSPCSSLSLVDIQRVATLWALCNQTETQPWLKKLWEVPGTAANGTRYMNYISCLNNFRVTRTSTRARVESTPGISVMGLTEAASGTVLVEAGVVLARRTRPALHRTLKAA